MNAAAALRALPPPVLYIGGTVLALIVLRQLGFFREAGRAAVGAAGDLLGGAVEGVGEQVGIPVTNQSECARAKAEGRTWDASFACPAGEFIGYVFGGADKAQTDQPPNYNANARSGTPVPR